MIRTYRFDTETNDTGERIDIFLARKLVGELSRSRIQALIKEGFVKVNQEIIKASTKIKLISEIILEVPEVKNNLLAAQDIPLDIIYEDQDLIVVNKPHGMVVHPAHGNTSNTLVNAVLYICSDITGIGGYLRPGIVHRLDKDTSGVIVICKNDLAHNNLSEQFKRHSVKKEYLAIVLSSDKIMPDQGEIRTLIGRSTRHRKKFSSKVSSGRESLTAFEVIGRSNLSTLVRARPHTGRTHQIRVHFSDSGFPILGDKTYGKGYPSHQARTQAENLILRTIKRQALHALKITFLHPADSRELTFTAPVPEDMNYIISRLY